jgi:putative N-acetylmannosamine-6-phosphate epimerase
MTTFAARIPRGLIVSCQAAPEDALHGPALMAAMAEAAVQGGAVAIRAEGAADIAAIRAAVGVPVVGVVKRLYPGSPVQLTPTFAEAREAAEAGAAAVALDGTGRPRPGGQTLAALIERVHLELQVPVLADVATVEDGRRAASAGADAVASTLAGYVDGALAPAAGPDVELVRRLVDALAVPVLAEGRYRTPEDAARAMAAGAYAVVVGTAITRPSAIAAGFAAAVSSARRG